MDEQRKTGLLIFEGPGLNEHLKVYWKLRSGELVEGGTWVLAVSFSPDFSVSDRAYNLLFKALSDSAIKVKLQTDEGVIVNCVIHDILDLDCGVAKIASPNLGGATITYIDPAPRTEDGHR
ncbi:MAG: hypothetical protein SVX38_11510 [Chloroflexota bacterium]|nr:hypothetical protein [Chloroflexota bacterium]